MQGFNNHLREIAKLKDHYESEISNHLETIARMQEQIDELNDQNSKDQYEIAKYQKYANDMMRKNRHSKEFNDSKFNPTFDRKSVCHELIQKLREENNKLRNELLELQLERDDNSSQGMQYFKAEHHIGLELSKAAFCCQEEEEKKGSNASAFTNDHVASQKSSLDFQKAKGKCTETAEEQKQILNDSVSEISSNISFTSGVSQFYLQTLKYIQPEKTHLKGNSTKNHSFLESEIMKSSLFASNEIYPKQSRDDYFKESHDVNHLQSMVNNEAKIEQDEKKMRKPIEDDFFDVEIEEEQSMKMLAKSDSVIQGKPSPKVKKDDDEDQ